MLTGRTAERKCIFIQFHGGAAFSSAGAAFEKKRYGIFSKAARFLGNGGRGAENAYLYGFGRINIQLVLTQQGEAVDRR